MSSGRSQDEWQYFLVHSGTGRDTKLGRVTPARRWIWVGGVLALASESPIRGHLLITTDAPPVSAKDVAKAADVSPAAAKAALECFRSLHMLATDDELGCEYVVNWHKHQPKISDERAKAAERQRRKRRRDALAETEKAAA